MDLPNELILEMCSHLSKPNLKACRLVSKLSSHHASEYLFSKVYISPRRKDIEVFNLIKQHAQLSHCVKHLEYDGTTFRLDYSVRQYSGHLQMQATTFSGLYKILFDGSDPQFRQFMAVFSENPMEVDIEQEFMKFAFILEGHRAWIKRAEYQQKMLNDGELLRIMNNGLGKLDRIASVEVLSIWDTEWLSDRSMSLSDHKYGSRRLEQPYLFDSPFGRSWGILHPEPRCWQKIPTQGWREGCQEYQEY